MTLVFFIHSLVLLCLGLLPILDISLFKNRRAVFIGFTLFWCVAYTGGLFFPIESLNVVLPALKLPSLLGNQLAFSFTKESIFTALALDLLLMIYTLRYSPDHCYLKRIAGLVLFKNLALFCDDYLLHLIFLELLTMLVFWSSKEESRARFIQVVGTSIVAIAVLFISFQNYKILGDGGLTIEKIRVSGLTKISSIYELVVVISLFLGYLIKFPLLVEYKSKKEDQLTGSLLWGVMLYGLVQFGFTYLHEVYDLVKELSMIILSLLAFINVKNGYLSTEKKWFNNQAIILLMALFNEYYVLSAVFGFVFIAVWLGVYADINEKVNSILRHEYQSGLKLSPFSPQFILMLIISYAVITAGSYLIIVPILMNIVLYYETTHKDVKWLQA